MNKMCLGFLIALTASPAFANFAPLTCLGERSKVTFTAESEESAEQKLRVICPASDERTEGPLNDEFRKVLNPPETDRWVVTATCCLPVLK